MIDMMPHAGYGTAKALAAAAFLEVCPGERKSLGRAMTSLMVCGSRRVSKLRLESRNIRI